VTALRFVPNRWGSRSKKADKPWIKSIKLDGSNIMKKRAQAVLALTVLAAGSAATAMAAEPPLQKLPLRQEIWITSTVQRSAGQFLSGNQTSLQLDRRAITPCNGHVMTAVVHDKAVPNRTVVSAVSLGAASRP
jgi:hypothetical protein